MGTFNILQTKINCPDCNSTFKVEIQFKYGDTWQYIFEIGDELRWGGNDIGNSTIKNVIVYGITSMNICPNCNAITYDEFDLFIVDNKIHSIRPMKSFQNYLTDSDGNFYITK
ncbi:hypothetical protein MUGA111182_19500 [Mucilaginibacter galii]|uniref:Uncharacterized protein n=1 Tax=Mucilaginibacter galii TaxID=2005073 RepID=A0A917J8A7_9SPHI|nr:hypothetical protein GCM10011425_05130 [Mucilaginibacter galii]